MEMTLGFTFLKKFGPCFFLNCDKRLDLQGVPNVRSSNFMRYNFRSKLYSYMKFLESVYCSIKYMYSEFQ